VEFAAFASDFVPKAEEPKPANDSAPTAVPPFIARDSAPTAVGEYPVLPTSLPATEA